MSPFSIVPVSTEFLTQLRGSRLDVAGHPVQEIIAGGGEPLRCCLRDAQPGEACLLFGYEPELPPSPYREIGAIFAHAETCGEPEHIDRYPAEWVGRPQVLRAYDDRGWIHPATAIHDGSDPQSAIRSILADPTVVWLHSRNPAYGCFMFAVIR